MMGCSAASSEKRSLVGGDNEHRYLRDVSQGFYLSVSKTWNRARASSR
jgi:hypothetical protein